MWSIACYPSYTPEGGVPRARRIFRRYLPAEILTYLIINFLWAGLSLWLISTLTRIRPRVSNYLTFACFLHQDTMSNTDTETELREAMDILCT
jgi:hypothetical protein